MYSNVSLDFTIGSLQTISEMAHFFTILWVTARSNLDHNALKVPCVLGEAVYSAWFGAYKFCDRALMILSPAHRSRWNGLAFAFAGRNLECLQGVASETDGRGDI